MEFMVDMMKKISAVMGTLLLAVSVSATAQTPEGLYLGPSLGYYYLDSDRVMMNRVFWV